MDEHSARAWTASHADTLLALARAAHATGDFPTTWHLVHNLRQWARTTGHRQAVVAIHETALNALSRAPEPSGQIESALRTELGITRRSLGHWSEAQRCFDQVLQLAERRGDQHLMAHAWRELAATLASRAMTRTGVDAERLQQARNYLTLAGQVHQHLGNDHQAALTDIVGAGHVEYHPCPTGPQQAAHDRLARARAPSWPPAITTTPPEHWPARAACSGAPTPSARRKERCARPSPNSSRPWPPKRQPEPTNGSVTPSGCPLRSTSGGEPAWAHPVN
ncbi:hypothetical protein [Streptomyces sp. NPDC059003]|uniref:hypothetical protein n=1 Tax=Streptomyces sp. NPDC059003 TaxID=3346691 RepID=UPI0036C2E015